MINTKKENIHLSRCDLSQKKLLTTKNAAYYLDVDPSYLSKRKKDGILKKGKHYYIPDGESIVRWDRESLETWFMCNGIILIMLTIIYQVILNCKSLLREVYNHVVDLRCTFSFSKRGD